MKRQRKIQTKRELIQYINRANINLYVYGANFRYDMRLRLGCGYSALVRVETIDITSPNQPDTAREIKLIAGRAGLKYWKLLEYLRDDFNSWYCTSFPDKTIGMEL